MNEKMHESKNTTLSFDTVPLEEGAETKRSPADNAKLYIKRISYRARKAFSAKCDVSLLSGFFDSVYATFLNMKMNVFGLFFIVSGAVALILAYTVNRDLRTLLTDSNTFFSAVILIIGLLLVTSGKRLCDLLSTSRYFSRLDIVYSQQSVFTYSSNEKAGIDVYSTAVFCALLVGFVSVVYPLCSIVMFLLSLIYAVFIFSRPECGLMLSIIALPFFSSISVAFVSIITFIALIYKYLRGKRHIDFRLMEFSVFVTIIYTVIRFSFSKNPLVMLQLVAFFLVFITTISLVRSTSMLRRALTLLISLSHMYTVLMIIYYLCVIFLGEASVMIYTKQLGFDGLCAALTSHDFILAFLSIMIPLCFSVTIGQKDSSTPKNLFYLVLLFILSTLVMSYPFILTVLAMSVLVMVLNNKKYILLLIPCPAAAFGIIKLWGLIPEQYAVMADKGHVMSFSEFVSIFSNNPLFGITKTDTISPNTASGIFSILLNLGIVGTIIVFALICVIIYKSVKSVASIKVQTGKSRTYAYGLICSAFSYIIVSVFSGTLSDFRTIFLFAAVLSLSFTSGRCYEADFVAEGFVRR